MTMAGHAGYMAISQGAEGVLPMARPGGSGLLTPLKGALVEINLFSAFVAFMGLVKLIGEDFL